MDACSKYTGAVYFIRPLSMAQINANELRDREARNKERAGGKNSRLFTAPGNEGKKGGTKVRDRERGRNIRTPFLRKWMPRKEKNMGESYRGRGVGKKEAP